MADHDELFREVFAHAAHAVAYLSACFDVPPWGDVDPASARCPPGEFSDGARADMLYEVRDAVRDTAILLDLEHQSSVDPRMPLRVLGYATRTLERFMEGDDAPAEPPAVFGVTLYQGGRPWHDARRPLWLAPEHLRSSGAVDLRVFVLFAEDARLHAVGPPDISLGVELLARARGEATWDALLRAPQRARDAFAARGHRYKVAIARYATTMGGPPEPRIRRALAKMDRELEEVSMGWAQRMREQFHAEGLEEGLQVGREEGLQAGLRQGRKQGREQGRAEGLASTLLRLGTRRLGPPDDAVTASVSGLSAAQLTAAIDQLFDATSWDDLLSGPP
jgi:predicted transposase YdaD